MDDGLLAKLANEHGTPLYVYDGDVIVERCRRFKDAFKGFPAAVKCCYAAKANTNLAVLRIIRNEGFGADIVSSGELDAVLKAGYEPRDIIYTSNAKSESDMRAAVDAGINVTADNAADVGLFKKVGGKKLAFRVNPDVDANTHPKISTALRGIKFGLHFEEDIAYDAIKKACGMGLEVWGIHCHIGSNIKETSAFEEAARKMVAFALRLRQELKIELDFIDLGGGLGVRYHDETVVSPEAFAKSFKNIVADGIGKLGYRPEFWFEPGRYIVAESGILLTSVISIKETPAKRFINVDAGFNDLIRPAMYDAYHNVRLVGKDGAELEYDVAGPLCESGDILAKDRTLPKAEMGDVIAVENAGAYGYSMASNYNSRPLPAEVLVRSGRNDLIRERQRVEELYLRQKIPKDLL
ncbi:MAG: diaminopimelate decarboxylase [Candidatus Altiarchaeota archaeon]